MTAVSFPDLEARSPDGRYFFTARSPDNEADAYSAFQKDFLFRLKRDGEVVWERRQGRRERSPTGLYVGENGYTVTQTHGYDYASLICRDGSGRTVGEPGLTWGEEVQCRPLEYQDPNIHGTTAGLMFPGRSLGYFFGTTPVYFGLHFAWFRRIIVDCETGKFTISDPEVEAQAATREIELGLKLFSRGLKVSAAERERDVEAALECLLHHRPPGCIELLREEEKSPATARSFHKSHTLDYPYCGSLGNRARVALALRLSGHLPSGLPGTAFLDGYDQPTDGGWPKLVPDRDERWNDLPVKRTARSVVVHLGVPDLIEQFSEKRKKYYHWGDRWTYFRGLGEKTERVVFSWKPGSMGETLESRLEFPVDRVFSPSF